jgi:ribonuclease HI
MEDEQIPRGVATVSGPVRVHFDGACEPPTGRCVATFGYHLEGGGMIHEDSGLAVAPYSRHSTNNVAEYVAAIRALEWLVRQQYTGDVLMQGDSELVIRQMLGEYVVRAEHLKAYHDHLAQLASRFQHVEWHWVPREQNVRADALSKTALEAARRSAPEPGSESEDESDENSESAR